MIEFERAKPVKAAQAMAQRIRSAILDGSIKIGERLPAERTLIEQFGYSRAVVREALRLLEDGGLIELQSGRHGGAVVRSPDNTRALAHIDTMLRLQSTDVREVHEAQRLIEPLVVQLAIERALPTDLDAVRRTVELIEEHPDDIDLVRAQSNLFHTLLGEATHNKVIAMIAALIRQIIVDFRYEGDSSEAMQIARIHRRILEAIEARDVKVAIRRTIRHAHASEDVLCSRTMNGPVTKKASVKKARTAAS
jgi:GntR family transcriptional regulator, transcriptional repressor for pyruvate dehydrogenase complex